MSEVCGASILCLGRCYNTGMFNDFPDHCASPVIRAGWLDSARRVLSPNQGERPADTPVDLLVIHSISLPPGQFGGGDVDALFQNRLDAGAHPYFEGISGLRVSAHLFIDRRGDITQYVSFDRRAWHAGASNFAGRENCNDFSIGIELEGTDELPFAGRQYHSLAMATRVLQRTYPGIESHRIVGHCDIAPGRKTDPGPCFDWRRYLLATRSRAFE